MNEFKPLDEEQDVAIDKISIHEQAVEERKTPVPKQTLVGYVISEWNLLENDDKRRNVVVLGLGMALLFAAFNACQNLQTTLNPEIGYVALCINYLSYACCALIMSVVTDLLGERKTFLIGCIGPVLFVAANIYMVAPIFLLTCLLNGFLGAMLWSAFGPFFIRCTTPETVASLSSLFFFLIQFNQIIGNLTSSILMKAGISNTGLFAILTVMGCLSLLSLLLTKDLEPPRDAPSSSSLTSRQKWEQNKLKIKAALSKTKHLTRERRFRFFAPYILAQGISNTLFYGSFTGKIGDASLIAIIMPIFGVADLLGSIVVGKILSKLDMCGASLLTLSLEILGCIASNTGSQAGLFVAAIAFGLQDAVMNVFVNIQGGTLFTSEEQQPLWSMVRFLQGLGIALAFFYSAVLPYSGDCVVAIIFFAISTAALYWWRKHPDPVAKPQEKGVDQEMASISSINDDRLPAASCTKDSEAMEQDIPADSQHQLSSASEANDS